jgi:hypothetical protein
LDGGPDASWPAVPKLYPLRKERQQMNNEQKKAYIAALLYERQGYERYGDKAALDAVDAELARVGHEAKAPAQRSTRMTKKKAETEL